jgi:hypothetical protein
LRAVVGASEIGGPRSQSLVRRSLPFAPYLDDGPDWDQLGSPELSLCSAEILPHSGRSPIEALSRTPEILLKGRAAASLPRAGRALTTSSCVQTDPKLLRIGWSLIPLGVSGYAPDCRVALFEGFSGLPLRL